MQKRAHRLSKPEMPPNKTNTEPILLKRGTIRDFEAGNQKDLEPYAQHSHLNLLTGKKTASMAKGRTIKEASSRVALNSRKSLFSCSTKSWWSRVLRKTWPASVLQQTNAQPAVQSYMPATDQLQEASMTWGAPTLQANSAFREGTARPLFTHAVNEIEAQKGRHGRCAGRHPVGPVTRSSRSCHPLRSVQSPGQVGPVTRSGRSGLPVRSDSPGSRPNQPVTRSGRSGHPVSSSVHQTGKSTRSC